MKSSNRSSKIKFILLAGISFVLHVFCLLLFIPFDVKKIITPQKEASQNVVVKLLDAPRDESMNKQIVNDTQQIVEKEINNEAEFFSKNNQKTLRQTRSKNIGSFKKAKTQTASVAKDIPKEEQKSEEPSLHRIGMTEKFKEIINVDKPKKTNEAVISANESSGEGQDLVHQNNDFIEKVPLGDLTQLNTKEHKFYGFYFRIRQKLEQHWGSSLQQTAEIMWKRGRRMPSNTNRITGVIVRINKMGEILEIKVKSSSGVLELDQAAVQSFNKAGPFPNPPKDLLENGAAEIEWGFVVKT